MRELPFVWIATLVGQLTRYLAIRAKKLASTGSAPPAETTTTLAVVSTAARLDVYPAVVRILTFAVGYPELYWPITNGHKDMLVHPRPEQRRLYTHLRPRLEWIGSAPESYRIIDGVVAALITALSLRDIDFLPPRS